MSWDIAFFLFQDGILNAAIYMLLALSLILVFSVTRVIFLPQGEFVSYGALTLATMQQGGFPNMVYVAIAFGAIAAAYEIVAAIRARQMPSIGLLILFVPYPIALAVVCRFIDFRELHLILQIVFAFAVVVPIGPMLYRIVFQPLASATVLVLLIAAVAAHLVMVGIGLLIFGPEGSRTTDFGAAAFNIGPAMISGQSIVVIAVSFVQVLLLAVLLSKTLWGKALRATAVNAAGARIVGIRPQMAGTVCFTLAAVGGVLAGVLISPITAIYYDSGFVIGLKGFVAAIIGGLVSYPIALVGAIILGVIEAFASFWASAYREVIVFAIIIPVLLVRSLTTRIIVEDSE